MTGQLSQLPHSYKQSPHRPRVIRISSEGSEPGLWVVGGVCLPALHLSIGFFRKQHYNCHNIRGRSVLTQLSGSTAVCKRPPLWRKYTVSVYLGEIRMAKGSGLINPRW